MPGLTPTEKIATLSVNSLQKCSRGRFNTIQKIPLHLNLLPQNAILVPEISQIKPWL